MGRKRVTEDDEMTISVRHVSKKEWRELENHIGGQSRSDFIRKCIKNQIEKTDTVEELKKKINDTEYQISTLQEQLKRYKRELGEVLEKREENADNELLLEQIMKAIDGFHEDKNCISEDKIRGIVREDFNDAISSDKVINRAYERGYNFVDSMKDRDVMPSKSYSKHEKEEEEQIKRDERNKQKPKPKPEKPKPEKPEKTREEKFNEIEKTILGYKKDNADMTIDEIVEKFKSVINTKKKRLKLTDSEFNEIIDEIKGKYD